MSAFGGKADIQIQRRHARLGPTAVMRDAVTNHKVPEDAGTLISSRRDLIPKDRGRLCGARETDCIMT